MTECEPLGSSSGILTVGKWGTSVFYLNRSFFWWLVPILIPLLFSVPLSVWSSKDGVGRDFRRRGLLNQVIPNIKDIAENTAITSEEVRKSVGHAGEAIRTISHETTDTVLTINETADYLAKYALVIGEIVKTIVNMFSSDKKILK